MVKKTQSPDGSMQRSSHAHLGILSISNLPRVVEHDGGKVFTGFGQIGHRQAEGGEEPTLEGVGVKGQT